MQQINWGIIGCGNVTEMKSGPAFNKVDGSRLIAVMSRNADKASDYARRHQVPKWYSNADELIADPEVNAVYIATPPLNHAEYALKAMERGKATYVEKPMAASFFDSLRMHEKSIRYGVPLYVAYYRRFLPYFIMVKEILDSGKLGNLLYARVIFHVAPRTEDYDSRNLPWRLKPEISGGGYFYDLACHQLDLLEWFFGNPSEVGGKSFNRRGLYSAEDVVFAHILYDSGIPVSGQWCFAAHEHEHTDTISVFGTKGSLEFSTFDFTPIRLTLDDNISEFLPQNPENIQYGFIKNMVEELHAGKPISANSESALRTNWVMDKILDKFAYENCC